MRQLFQSPRANRHRAGLAKLRRLVAGDKEVVVDDVPLGGFDTWCTVPPQTPYCRLTKRPLTL